MTENTTALHEHRGTRAIQRLVEFAPSTGGLALWVRHRDRPPQRAADPEAAADPALVSTDGQTLHYASGFEELAIEAQAGLVAHEVLHIALRHAQRYLDLQQLLGDVDLQLFNVCADAIVNSALAHASWLQLPPNAVQLDRLLDSALGLKEGVESALLEWDVERLYRAIDDRREHNDGSGSRARASPDGGAAPSSQSGSESRPTPERDDGPRASRVRALATPEHADLRPDPQAQGAPEDQAEQAREWSERILRAHVGDAEFSMLRNLLADLPRTRTPWEQVLRTQLARKLTRTPTVSWSRPARSYIANQGRAGPNRRMPWEPSFSGNKRVARLVVVVDVSGSIDAALLERFAVEIEAIVRRREAGLVLVIGDDRVQRVERFDPDRANASRHGRTGLREIEFNGGGGTDFTPLLEEADTHHPDITVVLTDLDGPARFKPRGPVLWAVPPAHAAAVAPFGLKLVLR
jgi:predicted metal-dependent peptidase